MKSSALIGYTGFVGGNIAIQSSFTDYYNSKNIDDITGKTYDLIVSAGNSGLMWKANTEPEQDLENIQNFIKTLSTVKAKHVVLLSTIEVYNDTSSCNEDTPINAEQLKPYGKHRFLLEEFVRNNFPSSTIMRMPNLFGNGLKKNFVFDLIHNNRLDLTHKDSQLQWYNLAHIWQDISKARKHAISVLNAAVEPIVVKDLVKYILDRDFTHVTTTPPKKYEMKTKYAELWNSDIPYLYSAENNLAELKQFILAQKNI